MKDNPPFEDMFDQIAELLKFVQDNAAKIMDETELPKGIEEKLNRLEKDVEEFKKLSEETVIQTEHLKEEAIKLIPLPKEEPNKDDQRLFEKANKLKAEVESMGQKFAKSIQEAKAQGHDLQKSTEKEKKKERKKKFRGLGGDEKWKRL